MKMKELQNLKTLNNKNLLVVLPINTFEDETLNESLYNLANQTVPTDVLILVSNTLDEDLVKRVEEIASSPYTRVLSTDEKGNPKSEIVKSKNTLNFAIETTTATNFASAFNEAFNLADTLDYKWISLVEKDDVTEKTWVENFNTYSSELENISIFLPLIRQVSAGNMIGHLNEATWLDGKAEVAGQADLQILMSWNCLSPTGCMINISDVKGYSEEKEDKFLPFKQSLKISSSYEFFLRMVYEDLKTYTIPRYGYQMRLDSNKTSIDSFSSKIPSNITSIPKENGGFSNSEIAFWLEQAKTEYFMSEDREIEYTEAVA